VDNAPSSARVSLIVITYERPDALAAVLETVRRQKRFPDELIVADDGSGIETHRVIERHASSAPYPVIHVRQPHEGYRVARLRNLAAARATHPLIVFVDGDMLLHPEFVADHQRYARHGSFTQGMRLPLDATLTRRLLANPGAIPSGGVGGFRRLYAVHAPRVSPLLGGLGNLVVAVKSCNLAVWREDLLAVNGFNEDFTGWGPEDKELAARLAHHGVRSRTLLFGGIAFHLHHAPASRERIAENERILALTKASRLERCVRGLDAHL